MFPKTNAADRALGLLGALGILLTGAVVTGEIRATRRVTTADAVHAGNDVNTASPSAFASVPAADADLDCHCDVVC